MGETPGAVAAADPHKRVESKSALVAELARTKPVAGSLQIDECNLGAPLGLDVLRRGVSCHRLLKVYDFEHSLK